MGKYFDTSAEARITYPPSGFFWPGTPRQFVRKAWKMMNGAGKQALEEYLILRHPDLTEVPKYYAELLEVRRQSSLHDGVVLERRAASLLESDGYFVARCSPVQPVVDLVAFATNSDPDAPSVRLIQVKAGRSVAARQKDRLSWLARTVGSNVRVEIWRFFDLGPQPKITVVNRERCNTRNK
jgi:hypothetical protein